MPFTDLSISITSAAEVRDLAHIVRASTGDPESLRDCAARLCGIISAIEAECDGQPTTRAHLHTAHIYARAAASCLRYPNDNSEAAAVHALHDTADAIDAYFADRSIRAA